MSFSFNIKSIGQLSVGMRWCHSAATEITLVRFKITISFLQCIHLLNVVNILLYHVLHSPTENCLDRHAAEYPNRTAIIWEKNEQKHEKMSYRLSSLQHTRVSPCLHDEEVHVYRNSEGWRKAQWLNKHDCMSFIFTYSYVVNQYCSMSSMHITLFPFTSTIMYTAKL